MDAAAKRRRSAALSNFTRNENLFNKRIENSAPLSVVTPLYEKVNVTWEALEKAHDEFLEVTDIDIEEDDGGQKYMDDPMGRYDSVLESYSNYLKKENEREETAEVKRSEVQERLEIEKKKREAKELKDAEEVQRKEEARRKFESRKAELDLAVESFQRMNLSIGYSLQIASEHDIRTEWSKVEVDFKLLKDKLIETVGIVVEDIAETEEVKTKFENNAEKVFLTTQKWVLAKLKDSKITSGGKDVVDGANGSTSSSSGSGTKKELAQLPSFEGCEKKSPYLKFPVWKKNWEELIVEHDVKWHRNFLFKHLDETAKEQLVGCEDDYEECMKRLTKHYGNPTKVVKCVMTEVMSPKTVAEGDYNGLVAYSNILERNYNRLKSGNHEHEMSNSTVMTSIMKKFPRVTVERWNEFLTVQEDEVRLKPFATFIEWVKSQRLIWEQMIATSSDLEKKMSKSNFGNVEKRCFGCDEVGHIRQDCPNKGKEGGAKAKGGGGRHQPRRKPKTKKFWCALHKGDPGRKCRSDSCEELRRLDPAQRIKLLTENKDCTHCVGDHEAKDCNKKDRICGGIKDDRGCTKSHKMHELFCKDAKVFTLMVASVGETRDGEVFLLIMQVRCVWKRMRNANVFWDQGSTSNFITIGFAEKCGFKGKKEDLNVTTLGGVTTDLTVTLYQCTLVDAAGNRNKFEAYGMETITGGHNELSSSKIKELFPHLPDQTVRMLQRGDDVDVLIGVGHLSWHPERVERAKGGGDFWICRGKFGTCLGGRYPGIVERTRKSDSLFHVNHTYHVRTSSFVSHPPHEFEFCETRVASYYQSRQRLNDSVDVEMQSRVVFDHGPASVAVPDSAVVAVPDSLHSQVDSQREVVPVPAGAPAPVSLLPDWWHSHVDSQSEVIQVPVVVPAPVLLSQLDSALQVGSVGVPPPVVVSAPVSLSQSDSASQVVSVGVPAPVVVPAPVLLSQLDSALQVGSVGVPAPVVVPAPVLLSQLDFSSQVVSMGVPSPVVVSAPVSLSQSDSASQVVSMGVPSPGVVSAPVSLSQSDSASQVVSVGVPAPVVVPAPVLLSQLDSALQVGSVGVPAPVVVPAPVLLSQSDSASQVVSMGVPSPVVVSAPVSLSQSDSASQVVSMGVPSPVVVSAPVSLSQSDSASQVVSVGVPAPVVVPAPVLQSQSDFASQVGSAGVPGPVVVPAPVSLPHLGVETQVFTHGTTAIGLGNVAAAESSEYIARSQGIAASANSATTMETLVWDPGWMCTSRSRNDRQVVHTVSNLNAMAEPFLPRDKQMSANSFYSKMSYLENEELFFKSESLGTFVEPQCGGCQCTKCPVPGSKYSFFEQRQFDIINKNLFRKDGVWYTEYPWSCSRSVLPKNDKLALQNLINLERMLSKNKELADDFCRQIDDMVVREAAVILSEEEVKEWKGDYYFIPLVGVKGKKKWLRICFDASRKQGGCPALNSCLHKGPDRFINNVLSVILGFRNGRVGAVADISKFHNRVRLVEEDIHMQRFLWRGMDTSAKPLTYAVVVNNFGVKPANCIATCALHQSADIFAEKFPEESQQIKDQTYVDDQLVAAANMDSLLQKTERMDKITAHADMPNKGWIYSGDGGASSVSIGGNDEDPDKVLGLLWVALLDSFGFRVVLRFGGSKGVAEVVVSSLQDFDRFVLSIVLTRRLVLANVARIFDPVGFLCTIILKSKLLMRASWCDKTLGWDDPLPNELADQWVEFLRSLLELVDVQFPRSLWPEEETVGQPSLLIFSDGAALAYGATAYIRWELKEGGFWSRLIMAKCKIGPKIMLSIPRMELNGAVMGNRMKNFILKDTNLEFGKVFQFVDSSTVLGYLQKESGNFKPYEGVRIAEVHSSSNFVDGKLANVAWVPTDDNPADWCTKPREVKDLRVGGFYEGGPEFLRRPEEEWPIKLTYKKEGLEGEVLVKKVFAVSVAVQHVDGYLKSLIIRSSSWKKMIRVLAWMIRAPKLQMEKSLSSAEVNQAREVMLKFAQKELVAELTEASEKGTGRYRKLAPVVDEKGIWRVGSRLKNFVPFTFDSQLPAILPPDSRVTLLIMYEAHVFAHGGQDATLSRFRSQGYWTVRGGVVAKKVKNSCVPCRKVDPKLLQQVMGSFPKDKLEDLHAWSCCQMDLTGPYECRSDVISRASKKTWCLILEDVNSGAVHLDIMSDYSTDSVLCTLRRFLALRGRPGVIHTDPGSQLESASGKVESWWEKMQKGLRELGSSRNFSWQVSPPDSPWRQGKAERRVGIVKRLLKFSVGDTRLTPLELQTALFEIADICNQRPIGLNQKPREDGTFDVVTPNNLLHGRSGHVVPDDADIAAGLPMAARYRLVHHVTNAFWKKWSDVASPSLIIRQKWHQTSRDVSVGDLVLICDSSPIKAKYKLGVVDAVHPSADGHVRSATVRYVLLQKNNKGEDVVKNITVKRSVQRLALILPVEEQVTRLEVRDNEFCSIVKAGV